MTTNGTAADLWAEREIDAAVELYSVGRYGRLRDVFRQSLNGPNRHLRIILGRLRCALAGADDPDALAWHLIDPYRASSDPRRRGELALAEQLITAALRGAPITATPQTRWEGVRMLARCLRFAHEGDFDA